ncbi:hypothetical protein CWO90_07080 [Bradyrhizobium sp. Leo121]|nr:hypothetical protein CWO90_07080 [Bradyrhizobium sp. Leo121]
MQFMQRLTPLPVPARSDASLAEVFLGNAAVKVETADWAASRGLDNEALHAIAIAIELLLKSYLLNVATDDDWNRANIGHDLAKALYYSTQAGLVPPPRVEWIISYLHPHFQRGGFQREASRSWPPGLARDACEVGRHLVQAIRLHVLHA